jgi:hypothetical protein
MTAEMIKTAGMPIAIPKIAYSEMDEISAGLDGVEQIVRLLFKTL